MSDDRIEVGDKVRVNYISCPGQSQSPYFDGEVLYIPNDVGDMFHIRVESGTLVYVNPSCSNLETIVRLPQYTRKRSLQSLNDHLRADPPAERRSLYGLQQVAEAVCR